MFRKIFSIILMLIIGLTLYSCRKETPVNLKPNLPPKTYLWVQADTIQSAVTSRQIIRWWGEDPDGLIQGYLFAYFKTDSVSAGQIPDTLGYSWVVKNDSLVAFPLLSARERFTVTVRAVDNSFRENINVGGIIRLKPEPYWDKNGNGSFDADDNRLLSITTAIDPVGAIQIFPIKNSPPKVEFSKDPLDPTKTVQQPESTFTVATFTWIGTDIDGDNTIKNYRINLNNPNDTTAWFEFSAVHSMITIEAPRSRTDTCESGIVDADVYVGIYPQMQKIGIVPGLKLNDNNKIYLQAKDLAGEYSPAVSLPDGTKKWFVKKPQNKLLTIANYGATDYLTVINTYRKAFGNIDTLPGVNPPRGFGNFDIIDIRTGSTSTKVGDYVPPILNPQFVRTLKLFDFVFWFTDNIPDNWLHVHAIAQFPLYLYSSSGGKILYSMRFGAFIGDTRSPLLDFTPVEQIIDTIYAKRIPNDWPIDPVATLDSFPRLRFNPTATSGGSHSLFVRNIIKQAGSEYIYTIPPDTTIINTDYNPPLRWRKRINLGVINHDRSFVFLSMPLHLMNGLERIWPTKPPGAGKGIPAFLKRVFIDEFGG